MSKYSKIAPKDLSKLQEYLGSLYTHINEGDHVLDIGCSTGYFGNLLIKTKNCTVNGVEIDENDIKKARKVLDEIYVFDLDGEWPKDVFCQKYDVVFIGDVIEHLKFPESTIRKIIKLLKPGGRILLSTPNVAHISIRLELLMGEFNYEPTGILDTTHLRLFTIRTLEKLAADTMCEIIDVDYSLVDFADTIISSLLKKAGLTPNERFWKLIESPEARAYQYKLVLKPLEKGKEPKSINIPEKPISEHERIYNDMRDQINLYKEAGERLASKASELEAIKSSRTWRLVQVLKGPYASVRRRLHE